jgi:hypothetical protein
VRKGGKIERERERPHIEPLQLGVSLEALCHGQPAASADVIEPGIHI